MILLLAQTALLLKDAPEYTTRCYERMYINIIKTVVRLILKIREKNKSSKRVEKPTYCNEIPTVLAISPMVIIGSFTHA